MDLDSVTGIIVLILLVLISIGYCITKNERKKDELRFQTI